MKSMNAIKTLLTSGLVLGFGLVLFSGCATQENTNPEPWPNRPDNAGPTSAFFPADSGYGKMVPFASVQVVNGAREDGNLVSADFTGSKLNSLGTEKLTRMVPEDDQDVTVYLNVPADDMQTARREAVASYLATCGVEASHLKIENGANPHASSDAAAGIANYPKTENTQDATAGGSSGAAPASGSTATH